MTLWRMGLLGNGGGFPGGCTKCPAQGAGWIRKELAEYVCMERSACLHNQWRTPLKVLNSSFNACSFVHSLVMTRVDIHILSRPVKNKHNNSKTNKTNNKKQQQRHQQKQQQTHNRNKKNENEEEEEEEQEQK